MNKQGYLFDAFISHAVEDKIPIANELCHRLERAGAKIWYCGRELNAGDSLRRTIKEGFSRSRYAIVIFSKSYLSKTWNREELVRLITKEDPKKKTILPVLYNVTTEELLTGNTQLSDRFVNRMGNGLDEVIESLLTEIKGVVPHNLNEIKQSKIALLKKRLKAIIA
jgi:hypothetical protein